MARTAARRRSGGWTATASPASDRCAEQPHRPIERLLLLPNAFLGIGVALLTGGFAAGGLALLLLGQAVPLTRLHGELLVFGALPTLVCGFAIRLLPRFFGAPPPRGAVPALVLAPFLAGATLRVAAAAVGPAAAAAALHVAAGILLLAGGVVFAVTAARLLRGRGGDRPGQAILFLLAALWLPASAALDLAGPAVPRLVALDAMLWGFAGGHILAVFARTAPAFVAVRPPPDAGLRLTALLWHLGLAIALAGAPAGWAATLGGAVALVIALGLYGRGIARSPLPAGARVIRAALRLAFGWLMVALALLTLRAAEQLFGAALPIDSRAARHAFTLGFLMPFIYAYGARLVPVLTGSAPPGTRVVLVIVVLANAGAAIRVAADALVRDGSIARVAVALSAAAATGALLLFVAMTVRRLRSGALAFV